MADPPTRSPERAGRSRPALRGWLAAATFVVGLFVGGIIVGLLSDEPSLPPAGSSTAEPLPAPGTGSILPPSSGSAAGGTGEVVVNDACLRAVNTAQDVSSAVDDLGEAAAELNAAQLDEVIRRLQPLQDRLQENIEGCEVVTRLPDGFTVTSTPAPSAAPASPS
jgi:hypothetical protein